MTPKEINGRIKAFSANIERKVKDYDLLSWMIGIYSSHSYHNPKKYPRKPEIIKLKAKLPEKPMDEENIKDILTAFAEIHNAIEGGK